MPYRYALRVTWFVVLSCSAQADDWPAFRGPNGDEISPESGFSSTWGLEQNIKWKVPLSAPSNGSPIVSNGHVFLTLAENNGRARSLDCFDRQDGRQDRVTLNCGPGKRVFVTALKLEDGQPIWEQVEPQDSQKSDKRADGAH